MKSLYLFHFFPHKQVKNTSLIILSLTQKILVMKRPQVMNAIRVIKATFFEKNMVLIFQHFLGHSHDFEFLNHGSISHIHKL